MLVLLTATPVYSKRFYGFLYELASDMHACGGTLILRAGGSRPSNAGSEDCVARGSAYWSFRAQQHIPKSRGCGLIDAHDWH